MNDDSDSSPSSSTSSHSLPRSAEASVHQYEAPSVERIVQHFVSSKRALSSASIVWRANELVTESRALLEELAVLNAKNIFAKRGMGEQLENLHAIREAITDSGAKAGDDFRTTIDNLDLANERLEKTLNDLRNTKVDSALLKRSLSNLEHGYQSDDEDRDTNDSYEQNNDNDEHEKNLYFYIDETRHEDLRASLRDLIDSFNDARESLDSSMRYLDESLDTIRNVLTSASRPDSDGLTDRATIYDEPPLSIPQLFHSMEGHASEMAALLQSLVSHYDLCVTALRHTEGGGAAAKQAIQTEHLSKDTTGVEESLYRAKTPAPMDEDERAALLNVLENDALEVIDVVDELKDHAASIERSFDQLSRQTRGARSCNADIKDALTMLHEMRDVKLPSHLDALATFRNAWQSIQTAILAKTEEIVALCDFHESFLADYGKLLREVERRTGAARQISKVAVKANKEIKMLEKADAAARAEFMEDAGKYLPTDLWPAMHKNLRVWTLTLERGALGNGS